MAGKKRQPPHISAPALDRLAVVSAELDATRRQRDASPMTEFAGYSDGQPSPYRPQASDAPVPKRQRVGPADSSDNEEARVMTMYLHRSMQQLTQLNADLSVLWPIIQSKQFLTRQEHAASSTGPTGSSSQQDQTLATVYDELLRLKSTVEAMFGQHISIQTVSTATVTVSTVTDTVRVLRSALDTLQYQLCRSPTADEVKTHTGPVLDRLWTQSRLAADEEMRTKLSLWKNKAIDLKESLRATIDRRTAPTESDTTNEDAKTLSVLSSALEFVSSLYLLEVVHDGDSTPNSLRKERAMAETTAVLSDKIHELQTARRAALVIPQASGSAPGAAGLLPPQSRQYPQLYDHRQRPDLEQHQPQRESRQDQTQTPDTRPTAVAAPTTAFDPNFSDSSDPPEEDEPLPVVLPPTTEARQQATNAHTTQSAGISAEELLLMGFAPKTKSSGAAKSSTKTSATTSGKKVPALAPRPASRPSSQDRSSGDPAKKKKKKFASKMTPAELAMTFARKRKVSSQAFDESHRHDKSESPGGERKIAPAPASQAQSTASNGSLSAPKTTVKRPHLSQLSGRMPAVNRSSHGSEDESKAREATAMTHTTPSTATQTKMKDPKPPPPQRVSNFLGSQDIPDVISYSEWVRRNEEAAAAESIARKETSGSDGSDLSSQSSLSPRSEAVGASPTARAKRSTTRSVTATGCAICLKNDSLDELLLCDNDCGREYHTFCLSPPMDTIPDGDWYCPRCLSVEQVENGDVFKCSATGCDKITGARYCSLHRCREPNCLNRIKAGGFCRRHEIFRARPKRARTPVTLSRIAARPATSTPQGMTQEMTQGLSPGLMQSLTHGMTLSDMIAAGAVHASQGGQIPGAGLPSAPSNVVVDLQTSSSMAQSDRKARHYSQSIDPASMSRRTMGDSPSAVDAPTFTCEVCKISVRSAQKLLDHVNFSPLHKAALEGGSGKLSLSGGGLAKGQRRVLYDGSKLFWRVNETLELCVYEDTGANSVTVAGFQQSQQQQQQQLVAVSPVVLDAQRLRKALGIPTTSPAVDLAGRPTVSEGLSPSAADAVVKFILARLQATKDAAGGLSLCLQRLHNGEADPTLLLMTHRQPHALVGLPSDLSVRRRHTIDDVKEAEKEVQVAAAELRQARQQAESFSQLARTSLEAFSRRNLPPSPGRTSAEGMRTGMEIKRRASDWVRVYDRVTLQNAVERSKEAMFSTLDPTRRPLQPEPQQ